MDNVHVTTVGDLKWMESPVSCDLNWSRLLSELMATSARLFQIRETSGKKECLADRVRVYGTRNLSPLPLVLVFRCVRWSSIGMSTRPRRMRNIMVARDFPLLSARVSQSRVRSIAVTRVVREIPGRGGIYRAVFPALSNTPPGNTGKYFLFQLYNFSYS